MARNDSKIPEELKPLVARAWGHWLEDNENIAFILEEIAKQMRETDKEIENL